MTALSEHFITDLRVHCVSIPARTTHSHGSGDISKISVVLCELKTNTGISGWGEASPWPVFSGTLEGNTAALHVYLRPCVIGKNPINVEQIMGNAASQLTGHYEAKAALETALLDIIGKITGLSIAELLGGRQRNEIPLSFSVANPDFCADLDDIAKIWSDGVRIFKLKTGFSDHAFDLMRLQKLRDLYDNKLHLRIDYNQGLAAYDAIRHIRDLEAFKPEFVEQPVAMNNHHAMAEITRTVDVPIMADESVFSPQDALQGAVMRIADIFSLKIAKSGGLRKCLEVATIARAAGIEVYGGCMFETSIAHMAGAQLMAAIPDLKLGCEFYMSSYYAEADLTIEPFPVKDGHVIVPALPGLGAIPNLELLEHYRTQLLV